MFIDFAKLASLDEFEFCVIGSGFAGITIANRLEAAGHRVLMIEGGNLELEWESQEAYEGTVIGDPYDIEINRLRMFGGSSEHWGGMCRPLDPVDFEAKPYQPLTQWPISRTDLDPYLARARELLEIPAFRDDILYPDAGLLEIDFNFSPPVRFNEKYREDFRRSANKIVALRSNAWRFESDGARVTGLIVRGYDGSDTRVSAKTFILCTGGIENSRLLLWSNAGDGPPVVKNTAALGRYWMEHPHFDIGQALLTDRAFSYGREQEGYEIYFGPTRDAMLADGALNCGLRMLRLTDHGGAKKLVMDLACVAPRAANRMFDMLGQNEVCSAKVQAAWEQPPRAENRIELAEETDAFGMPRVNLYWRKDEQDRITARSAALRLGKLLALSGQGWLRLDPWLLDESTGFDEDAAGGKIHHMGGTRMASDPRLGVVDANCKVHGQSNLYVGGSSVFPSSGHANPTLTIVQMSLRLADHLLTR